MTSSGTKPRAYDMGKRSAAAARTRRRIAAAALDLLTKREYDDVTLGEIAQVAGVSHQTVLNHFDSKVGVLPAAAAVFSERVAALELDAVPGDIASIVRTTCVRYEQLGDVNVRWAAMESRHPEISGLLAAGRTNFQHWLTQMLGDVMPGGGAERTRVLLGLHAALDVHTWKLFRRDLGLSQRRTELQVTDLVLGVLAQHRT